MTTISFGGGLTLIAQVFLLVLHYGNSNIFGVVWGSLPWWIVWFPTLISVVLVIIFLMIIFIVVWLG